MTDFLKCLIDLQEHDVDYIVCHYGMGHKIICFDPYVGADDSIIGYVYNWVDTYDYRGELVEHKVYNER